MEQSGATVSTKEATHFPTAIRGAFPFFRLSLNDNKGIAGHRHGHAKGARRLFLAFLAVAGIKG
jgi:hypothetical protein